MKYNTSKLGRRYFPWFWQTATNLRLLGVITGLFDNVNDLTSEVEQDYSEKAGYSIQRLSLETSLNIRFDPDLKRIEIVNGEVGGNDFIFNEGESVSSSLFVYVFNEAEAPAAPDREFWINENESLSGATSFTVLIPSEYMGQEALINQWINEVLIFGTQYTIQYV